MKKRVIIAALVCGFLGSSYASSSFQNDRQDDPFNQFRSTRTQSNLGSERRFNQRPRLRTVENRFSSTASPPAPASSRQVSHQPVEASPYPNPRVNNEIEQNYVVNDKTGQKVYLDQPRPSSSAYRTDQPRQATRLSETSQYRDGSAYRSQSAYGSGPAQGFRQSPASDPESSRWKSPQRVEATRPAPVERPRQWGQQAQRSPQAPRGNFEEEIFGSQARVQAPQTSVAPQRRGPRVRKNVRSVRPVRRRRSWFSNPFRKLGKMFTGLFRW